MIKHCLLVLLAAGLISVAAPFAAAQDSQSTDQQIQGNGRWHHPQGNPAQRTHELAEKLDLTPDQQSKVMDIYQGEHTQLENLRQDNSNPQQDERAYQHDLRAKMMEIHKNTSSQIRAVLDATQQKKWDKMQAKREDWGHKGQAGSGDQQAPPPQQ